MKPFHPFVAVKAPQHLVVSRPDFQGCVWFSGLGFGASELGFRVLGFRVSGSRVQGSVIDIGAEVIRTGFGGNDGYTKYQGYDS